MTRIYENSRSIIQKKLHKKRTAVELVNAYLKQYFQLTMSITEQEKSQTSFQLGDVYLYLQVGSRSNQRLLTNTKSKRHKKTQDFFLRTISALEKYD